MPKIERLPLRNAALAVSCVVSMYGVSLPAADASTEGASTVVPARSMSELQPIATIRVGKTADWVAITPDAVWVGSTGPDAVHRIDPKTNQLVATIKLPGEPCAGLATGFGSLWVPLCSQPSTLAQVDLEHNSLRAVLKIGPAGPEGGVTTSVDSVWLVTDKNGSLARIDPEKGVLRQMIKLPAGSYNPFYFDGQVWITHADGSEVTSIDARSGTILGTATTGPNPRFLSAGAGAVWTLNQGDGSLSRIDPRTRHTTQTIVLGTPGHGGDISVGNGMVWTTMAKVPLSATDASTTVLRCRWAGPGGDSLGIGHDAIWLTDYHGGTISRLQVQTVLGHCR
jgi:virginiamycin B lyase